MKKLIACILLAAMVFSFAACGNKEPDDAMYVPVEETPSSVLADPTPTPDAGLDIDVFTPAPIVTDEPSPTPESTINPDSTEKPAKALPKNLKEAQKISEDVYGWIKVPNTNIDYPIMYSKNWYYNTHDIYKNETNSGSIYSYYKQLTRNNIITGHNMRKAGTMLNGLHKLKDKKEDLKTKSNRTFSVDWFGLKKWEVFAFYETTDSEPKATLLENTHHLSDKSSAEITAWINKQKSRSEIDLGVSVSPDDFLMTIVTCGANYDYSEAQSRLYFFLKCID